jgi:hypothetical protein
MAPDDEFEPVWRACGAWRTDHEAGADSRTEQLVCGARHRHGRLARRDHAKRTRAHGVVAGRGRALDEAHGVNGGDAGGDDVDEILAKSVE